MAGVPLLLLTADRPPELRHSGANQTIDQVKMYGDHVLWAVDAALPERDAPDVALRSMRTLAARCYAVANGIRKGPVNINFPFRKPLEPETPYRPHFDRRQSSLIQRGVLSPTTEQIEEMLALVSSIEQGWIVCGPWAGHPPSGLVEAIADLGRSAGYPVFADPLSGLRFGRHTETTTVISSFESFLQHSTDFDAPKVVLRFGAVPTSKYLNEYLERIAPPFQGARAQRRSLGRRQPPRTLLSAGRRDHLLPGVGRADPKEAGPMGGLHFGGRGTHSATPGAFAAGELV